jgi:hypothetical protein
MNADCRRDSVGVLLREPDCGHDRFDVTCAADAGDTTHTSLLGALEDLTELVEKAWIVEVAMRVEEHR